MIDRRCSRVEKVLLEQFRSACDQEDETDAEYELPCEFLYPAEAWFDERLDDTDGDDVEFDRKSYNETGRDQFEQRLLESSLAFLDPRSNISTGGRASAIHRFWQVAGKDPVHRRGTQ